MRERTPGIGDLLIRQGLITQAHLDEALAEQTRTRERVGEILCRLGYLSESDLLDALADQLGHRRFDPARDGIEHAALNLVPLEFARRHNVLPVRVTEQALSVAVADPTDLEAIDHLKTIAGRRQKQIELLLAPSDVLRRERESSYARIQGTLQVSELIDKVVREAGAVALVEEEPNEEEAQRRAQEAGVVDLVDQIIVQALQERATDIHIEPLEQGLVIRYRVDGLLHDALTPPREVYTGAISRVKILANMDIAERRAPQDGRFTHAIQGQDVDVRVSSIPTIHGEKLVLRLLDKSNFNFSLQDIGFSEADYQAFLRAIRQPFGMVLLSGPTGSGKSTTLYAGLLALRDETVNITTIEDPVEYQMARVNQVQVNARKNVTFATALRHFLRQDPDVIMVGEIRDKETAEISVRAALTGHMVFSTIHANDAPSTATRLVSMGVEAFTAASALSFVAAQRLVRRNCRHCLEDYRPSSEVLLALGFDGRGGRASPVAAGGEEPRFRRGKGCALCRGRGYLGRVAIIERMSMSAELRQLMAESRPASELRRVAISEGLTTLRASGVEKALAGVTTVEEVLRVCLADE